MAVLVTRPHPDDETTAAGLRARGFEVLLAPMLRFEPVAFDDDEDMRYGAVIVTSANALRGIERQLKGNKLLKRPLFAVGDRTASAARGIGFETVISAKGDAASLRDLVLASVKAKALKKASPLLYLAGADLAGSSVGASLALEVAALWPASVRRIAAIAPFGLFDETTPPTDPWVIVGPPMTLPWMAGPTRVPRRLNRF